MRTKMWLKIDSIMEKLSSPFSYTASGSLVIFGLSLNDLALLIGIITGVGTFFINWYYTAKRSRRDADSK